MQRHIIVSLLKTKDRFDLESSQTEWHIIEGELKTFTDEGKLRESFTRRCFKRNGQKTGKKEKQGNFGIPKRKEKHGKQTDFSSGIF